MSSFRRLQGSCNCGRYNYVVVIPEDESVRSVAQVHFGTGSEDRRSQASLLSAWLRVPLDWYQSATVSFFDDERHEMIQRTFTSFQHPESQRKFCGFCGTHMSYWTETPEEEQDYMNVTLGSLRHRDIEALEQMELLPGDLEEASIGDLRASESPITSRSSAVAQRSTRREVSSDGRVTRSSRQGNDNGVSWFEDIIEGSRLGYHSKKRRGQGTSADGSMVVQWEVTEFAEGEDEDTETISSNSNKRKAADIAGDDVPMNG